MDIKGSDPSGEKGSEKNDGCAVIGVGCLICYGTVIAVILIGGTVVWIKEFFVDGGIVVWVVNDAMPIWRWMTHNKEYRLSVVIAAIFSLLAFFIPLQEPRGNVFVCVLQGFAFVVCSFFACFFVFVAAFEILAWITKWIEEGY